MFRVQILGSHLRSREVYRVCVDIIHSLHERYIFIRTYVYMGKARRHEGVLPYPTGLAKSTRDFRIYQLYVRMYGIEMLRGVHEKF